MIRAQLRGDTGIDPGICECSAEGITARGFSPVIDLCRKLLAAGWAGSLPMQVFRGEALCLHVSSIGAGACLRLAEAGFKADVGYLGSLTYRELKHLAE